MSTKFHAVLDAVLPALLVATIAGVCLSAADYVALVSAEHVLERWSWLPSGWGRAHEAGMAISSFLMTSPAIGFIAWSIYRTARRAQL